jgi:chromosome segregation and condensation protein ScpB
MTVRLEEVATLVQNTPITKEDLTRILKARKVTRDDLAQLVRDWKD